MSNSKDKSERRKKAFFPWSWSLGVFIIASMFLAGCSSALTISVTILTTAAFAQEGNNTTTASTPSSTTATTTTTTADTSSGIQLLPQPVMQEQTTSTSTIPINQTHLSAIFSGNGTATLPNSSDTINYTTNGTAVIALETHSVLAEETLM